jgi:ligand-binding sensor domain-containing protein
MLLISAICFPAAAQSPDLRVLDIDNHPKGSSEIYAAVEDSTGLLWFLAWDGLWRYDGSNFELYKGAKNDQGEPIPMFRITSGLQSAKRPHWFWLGSDADGLWGLDIHTGRTEHYRHDPTSFNTPGGNRVTSLLEMPNGQLWFTSDNYALSCFDGHQFRVFIPPVFPGGPATPSEGVMLGVLVADTHNPDLLWVGSRFGLYRFDTKQEHFEFFPFDKPMPWYYEGATTKVYIDPAGIAWAGGMNSGLRRLDPATRRWQTIEKPSKDTTHQSIFNILPGDDGRLLVTTYPEIFWRYDPLSGQSTFETPFEATGSVSMLAQLKKKTNGQQIWFILHNGSTITQLTFAPRFFKYKPFQAMNPALVRNNWQRAYCLAPDEKSMLIGTLNGQGILRWYWRQGRQDTVTLLPHPDLPGISAADIRYDELCLDPDGHTLWVGTNFGLFAAAIDGPTLRWLPRPVFAPKGQASTYHITTIFADDKVLWLGTVGDGVWIMDKKTGQTRSLFRPGSDLSKIIANTRQIYADSRHNRWLCTDEGLLCLSEAENVVEKFLPANSDGETLGNPKVSDIQEDKQGKLWIATYGGLIWMDPDAPRGKRLTVMANPANDLSNYVNDILLRPDGTLWLGTEGGLSIFTPTDNKFVNYGPRDGFYYRMRMLAQLPDNRVISGANHGFILFEPNKITLSEAPRIYWRDFRIFNRPALQAAGLNTLPKLVLQPGENYFSFEFGAINFEENARNTFAYQLEGYDQEWINSGERTFVGYTNLPPGTYTFRVKAANRFGIWSEPRSIGVRILPPYYRTWWFALLMLTLSGLIVWQIARIWKARQQVKEIQRTVRAEAEEAVRRKEAEMLELEKNLAESQLTALKAQMNPHFLFNSLNSINWYIARNRPNEASRYLTKFSRLIRLILDNSKHQRIPLSGEMEALRLYIEMESIRFEQKFSYEIEMDESLDSEEVTIAPMILQPYVENAIWHGLMPLNGQRPGHLRISITPENGRLHCVIEDNGIGREAAHILKGASLTGRISKGMRITADRITILNQGERIEDLVQITDLTDANGNAAGTRIELKLPYNHEPVDEIR